MRRVTHAHSHLCSRRQGSTLSQTAQQEAIMNRAPLFAPNVKRERATGFGTHCLAAIVAGVAMLAGQPVTAAPAAGDTYVYRVINGYSKEVLGNIRYQIDKVDADRVTVSVTTDVPALGVARTEVVTPEGNWLRHPVINHDRPVEYEFSPAFPAYVFPLESRKAWSTRISAVHPVTGRRNSVRVDGNVVGPERVTVPGGSFDTIKVRRRVYAGDWDGFRMETNIIETDWYAPQLGRPVKSESTSNYMQPDRCVEYHACTPILGDWNVLELIEARVSAPSR
jgi:hypothetical protein